MLSFPLHLSVAQNEAGVSTGQHSVGIPKVPALLRKDSPKLTHLLLMLLTFQLIINYIELWCFSFVFGVHCSHRHMVFCVKVVKFKRKKNITTWARHTKFLASLDDTMRPCLLWWYMPVILVFMRRRQREWMFKVILSYTASSRPASLRQFQTHTPNIKDITSWLILGDI